MAFDQHIINRIQAQLDHLGVTNYEAKKMFSGVCFMVDNKMCLGSHIDKKTGESFLLCRMSETDCQQALATDHCIPMEFTGKAMKGYIFVLEQGYATDEDLLGWIKRCLAFNPVAKASKK